MSKKQVKIITKNSKNKGISPSNLEYGELAINYADKKLFFKDDEDKINSVDLSQPFAEAEDGAAKSAKKLTTNAGSDTQPVYFTDGKPSACTYSLNKTVPSDAKFTDTTYNVVAKNVAGLCPALPNETTTTKYLRQDGTWVTPPNDNTTYSAGTGLSLSGTTFNHTNSVTAREQVGENSNIEPAFGDVINIPYFDHDTEGHITKSGTTKIQLPKSTASTTQNGLMSSDDKKTLDTIKTIRLSTTSILNFKDSITINNGNLYEELSNATPFTKLLIGLDYYNIYSISKNTVGNLTAFYINFYGIHDNIPVCGTIECKDLTTVIISPLLTINYNTLYDLNTSSVHIYDTFVNYIFDINDVPYLSAVDCLSFMLNNVSIKIRYKGYGEPEVVSDGYLRSSDCLNIYYIEGLGITAIGISTSYAQHYYYTLINQCPYNMIPKTTSVDVSSYSVIRKYLKEEFKPDPRCITFTVTYSLPLKKATIANYSIGEGTTFDILKGIFFDEYTNLNKIQYYRRVLRLTLITDDSKSITLYISNIETMVYPNNRFVIVAPFYLPYNDTNYTFYYHSDYNEGVLIDVV